MRDIARFVRVRAHAKDGAERNDRHGANAHPPLHLAVAIRLGDSIILLREDRRVDRGDKDDSRCSIIGNPRRRCHVDTKI